MPESSIYDLVVEELLERQKLVKSELRERFRKTKPFRQEPISPKEALVEYDEMTPEIEGMLRKEFGDEVVNSYIAKNEKLREKYQ